MCLLVQSSICISDILHKLRIKTAAHSSIFTDMKFCAL